MYSFTLPILFWLASFLANANVGRQSSKLRMIPAFEASLVLNSLSLVAGASLLICLVRMRFCWENPLSQLAVWRGSVRAICVSLMRSGSSSLWCFVRSSHSPYIVTTLFTVSVRVSMPLSVRMSGFVMSESWFALTVSALTGTVTGALNNAVSFLWLVSSSKTQKRFLVAY